MCIVPFFYLMSMIKKCVQHQSNRSKTLKKGIFQESRDIVPHLPLENCQFTNDYSLQVEF
jgi:hypothetical protein